MALIKQILVPIDFNPASDIAFSYAVAMAASQGSTLHLLHVIDDTTLAAGYPDGFYAELPGLRQEVIEEATTRLEAMAVKCTTAGVRATTQVAFGDPARVITETAIYGRTDLIVVGTHGRGGFAHLILGSVAERVVRTAPCPVVTVRDTLRVAQAPPAGVVTRQAEPQPV